MSEAAKVFPLIKDYLNGKRVLDLGCGDQKVVPWAVGVDDCTESAEAKPDLVAKVGEGDRDALLQKLGERGLPGLGGWPIVFSSHTLEHLWEPVGVNLWWWWSLVAPRGFLLLYLPNERRYVYSGSSPNARNPAHRHLLVPDVVRWHISQITGANLRMSLDHDYSSLFIVEKMQ